MSKARRISENDADLIALLMRFRKEHANEPFETGNVAAWAVRKRLWFAPPRSAVRELKKELSRVAKKARHTDPQGRRVRTMHAAKILYVLSDGKFIQKVLWDHIDTMSADHAQTAFQQRWDILAGASVSLKQDQDSFNQNNPNAKGKEIYLDFNFEPVVDAVTEAPQEVHEIPLPDLPKPDSNEPAPPS